MLSAIGIIDHIDHIESGGIYFVLTHILGARIGATVGILYCFGQVSETSLMLYLVCMSSVLFDCIIQHPNFYYRLQVFLYFRLVLANLWPRPRAGTIIGQREQ